MSECIDVCVSFDTTGSMYPCLTQVRRYIGEMVGQLFKDMPDLRIAIIAHGDYCDEGNPYTIKMLDFSKNEQEIKDFILQVEPTYGGDAPECYELVLHEARRELSWESGREKALVIIGDDVPHGPHEKQNMKKIDWRNEIGLLIEAGIHIYGVHAMPGIRKHAKPFYEEIANRTGGFYLTLDQFTNISTLLMAICYKQEGGECLTHFREQLKIQGKLNYNLKNCIARLQNESLTQYQSEDGLIPVPEGRFQELHVDEEISIKTFILEQGANFKVGRGFYELTKSEKVGRHKEILLVEKETGKIFNGAQVREILGLSSHIKERGYNENLKAVHLEKYKVFIQSTSYNRKLMANTSLLYEIEDWDREGEVCL